MKTRLVTFSLMACVGLISFSLTLSGRQPDRLAQAAVNAQAQNIELVGQIGGATTAIAIQGNYVYLGVGPRLVVLNVADPAHPSFVGQSDPLPGAINNIAMAGSYAYIANAGGGLRIVSVSDPTAPVEVGFYTTPYALDVAVTGNYAYLADGNNGLRIINVSNPVAPFEVGACGAPDYTVGVVVAGAYAYLAAGNIGLRIVNVANPAAPFEVGVYNTPGYGRDVAIAGAYAYLADDSSGLRVINVSSPSTPFETGFYDTGGYANNVVVVNNRAYVADAWQGLRIMDVSNPSTPVEIGFYDPSDGGVYDVAIAGNYAYVADGHNGLRAIAVSNPAAPYQVGVYDPAWYAYEVAVVGDYAYVAGGDSLYIIAVSNPAAPSVVGFYRTPGSAYDVVVAGHYAYIAGYESGLRIVNVSNPAAPFEVGFYDTPGYAFGIAMAGNYVYLADSASGLHIINVSNPAAPYRVGGYDTPGDAWDVTVAGSYAYVADRSSGLRIVDVSNPAAPFEVGFYDTPEIAQHVAVVGGYTYVADSQPGKGDISQAGYLRVINSANPAAPFEVGAYNTPGVAWSVAVAGSYAYVPDGDNGLCVVNIANPAAPSEAGLYDTVGFAQGLAVVRNPAPGAGQALVYLADGSGGLVILRYSEPAPTPTPTHTPTLTPLPTLTPTPVPPDAYELDDACAQAGAMATIGDIQVHTFHQLADQDWVVFTATTGITYVIEARAPAGSAADVTAELYQDCNTVINPGQDPGFSPDIRMVWHPPADGAYHLRLRNYDPADYGADRFYHLSVRALNPDVNPGALVLAAGRYYSDPVRDVQANIQHVSNTVYRLFRQKSYPPEHIYYLATDKNIDASGDGVPDVNALSSKANLRDAIINWTQDKGLGPERAFTLYLVDHGGVGGVFYLDKPYNEQVTVQELDGWLDQLEAHSPGVKVNVVIEACFAGGFVRGSNALATGADGSLAQALHGLSGPGRVVAASTEAIARSHASPEGAWFSDALLDALAQDMSLAQSFNEGAQAAVQANPDQIAWLDGDGDGLPNRPADYTAAAQRGFAFKGSLVDEAWPPYIKRVEVKKRSAIQYELWAEVRDDQSIQGVWAVVYPPGYSAGTPEEVLAASPLPENLFFRENDEYGVLSSSFATGGEYRVIVYARDNQGLHARPVEVRVRTGWATYLPLIIKCN